MQFPVFRPLRPETAILMPIRLIAFLCRCLRRSGHEFSIGEFGEWECWTLHLIPTMHICITPYSSDAKGPGANLPTIAEQEVETPQRCCKPHPKPSVPPRAPWRSPGELLRARRENCRPRPCESWRADSARQERNHFEVRPNAHQGPPVGAEIASFAAAATLIRDGNLLGTTSRCTRSWIGWWACLTAPAIPSTAALSAAAGCSKANISARSISPPRCHREKWSKQ
jgi:hypothetical protein